MREIRPSGLEGGVAFRHPYPYPLRVPPLGWKWSRCDHLPAFSGRRSLSVKPGPYVSLTLTSQSCTLAALARMRSALAP
jgi:hypothetical protein